MEEGTELGWEKGPHGILSGGYDAECAAIARALAVTAERSKRYKLGRVRIFTDAQAAITRMTCDEPGPSQTYALQARKAIAALREREPSVEIEIRWCPAHRGSCDISRGTRLVSRTTEVRSGSRLASPQLLQFLCLIALEARWWAVTRRGFTSAIAPLRTSAVPTWIVSHLASLSNCITRRRPSHTSHGDRDL